MNNKEITKRVYTIFKDRLKVIGLKQLRPGKYFYKTDYGYLTLDLQKSQYSLLFYVNFGAKMNNINAIYRKGQTEETNSDLFYEQHFHNRFETRDLVSQNKNILDFDNIIPTEIDFQRIEIYVEQVVIPECKKMMNKSDFLKNVKQKDNMFNWCYRDDYKTVFF